MVPASSNGTTAIPITVSSSKIPFKETASTNGKTEDSITELGIVTKCMDSVSLLSQMEGDTKEIMLWIKRMVKVTSIGPMEDHIKACGRKANKMDKEYTHRRAVKFDMVFGKKENEFNGLKMERSHRLTIIKNPWKMA
jgi:hypothetical protein